MVQRSIYTDSIEDYIIEKYSKEWKISLTDTIKQIIKKFDKLYKESQKNE